MNQIPYTRARLCDQVRPSGQSLPYQPYNMGYREGDLDIAYSLVYKQNVNLMLTRCLRHWLNINPTLTHVTSRVCCNVVGAVCHISGEIRGQQTRVV